MKLVELLFTDKAICDHKNKSDLAPFTTAKEKGESHYMCHKCGAHWYKGKFYTKKEWEDWVNS